MLLGVEIKMVKNKHLIVISIDAMVTDDLEYADKLPTFHELISKGTVIKKVMTIYPSLTHCVHASIITGKAAGETGVTENTMFTPGMVKMPWFNKYSDIKCETIFSLAKKAGLTTASCRWPVTANAGADIDYLVPEIMRKDLEGFESDPIQAYINDGTTKGLVDIVNASIKKNGASLDHPIYDEAQADCVCEIIKRYKPNLLLTHPGFVDSERHRTGLFSPYVLKSLEKTEEWLAKVVDATKEAGIFENTDFILLSDHGHCPYHTFSMPNVKLVEEGLITLDSNGNVKDWQAYIQSCDLSAHVYLKNSEDSKLTDRVEKLLQKWIAEDSVGIESYMSAKEAKEKYGLFGNFSFTIEAKEGFSFEDEYTGPLFEENPPVEPGLAHSAHGHLPHKGPQPIFIGFGPHFEKGKVEDNCSILDHFDTFRRVLEV